MKAAIAAECAADQSRFAEFHDFLFDHQDSIGVMSWESAAQQAGVPDLAAFEKCRSDAGVRIRVEKDMRDDQVLGVTGTPTIVIGNELIAGAAPIDSVQAWLRRYAKS